MLYSIHMWWKTFNFLDARLSKWIWIYVYLLWGSPLCLAQYCASSLAVCTLCLIMAAAAMRVVRWYLCSKCTRAFDASAGHFYASLLPSHATIFTLSTRANSCTSRNSTSFSISVQTLSQNRYVFSLAALNVTRAFTLEFSALFMDLSNCRRTLSANCGVIWPYCKKKEYKTHDQKQWICMKMSAKTVVATSKYRERSWVTMSNVYRDAKCHDKF